MQPVRVNSIADIARLAGVSKSTVSRALNDSPLIGVGTKERIQAIASEHRFELNVPARRLSRRQSETVALAIYKSDGMAYVPDTFMLEVMSGISASLHELGYDLLVVHVSPDDRDWGRRYFEAGRVDGFIMSMACEPQDLVRLTTLQAPFIAWGRSSPNGEYSSVGGDSISGGKLATEHLLGSGRRRIAFLGGPATAPEVQERYSGYEAALQEAGLAVDPALVVHARWQEPERSGDAAMHELLDRVPKLDAVFANSDLLAFAAMDAIRARGRRVPQDVAVVGYDDVSIARHSSPPLTTIRQNGPLAGKLLAENLIQQLRTGAVSHASIPAELVVRESA